MKKIYVIALAAAMTLSLTGCNDFLDYTPTAVVDEDKAFSDPEKMVNSAYAMLGDCWYSYPFNLWPYGDLASDDCLKGGGGTGDTGYHDIEVWSSLTSTRGELDELWYRLFCAVSRCNRALVSLEENGNNVLGGQTTTEREAEVRFLRAHFYFKLISVFRQVPWIDEQVFGKVIDDFKFAYDNLPEKQSEGGRANKIAAAAYLAKCYLTLAWGDGYEATDGVSHINKDYMQKVVDYTDVVKASHYGYLEDYGDIFLPDYKNSKESIFAVQASDYSEDHTPTGPTRSTAAGASGRADGTSTSLHRTSSMPIRPATVCPSSPTTTTATNILSMASRQHRSGIRGSSTRWACRPSPTSMSRNTRSPRPTPARRTPTATILR